MTVNSNIDDIIAFLQQKKEEGYKTVELVNDDMAHGWRLVEPTLKFIFCKNYPTILGIDARSK